MEHQRAVIPTGLADEIKSLQLEAREFDLGERVKYIRDGQLLVNLSGLSLTKIPPSVMEITDIHHLDLSLNNLNDLPDLSILDKLISISLRFNKFSKFPETLFNTNLFKINLENNDISSLPDRFEELKELLFLDLAFNELNELPPSFSKLVDMMKLDLQRNKFVTFPESVVQLTALRNLDVSSNKLEDLPERLAELRKMRFLDVSDNNIPEIPSSLSSFTELTFFDVSDNDFENLESAFAKYDNKIKGFDVSQTDYQYTRTQREHDFIFREVRSKSKSVDWDSHFNLESLIPKDEFKSDVSKKEYVDRDAYLEQKFLLIDF